MSIAAKDGTGAAITLENSGNSPDNLVNYIGSVIPGTTATKLGKAEDAAHTTGDVGVMVLGVRESTDTDLSANTSDGDYEPFQVDATGRVKTHNSEMRVVVSVTPTCAAATYTTGRLLFDNTDCGAVGLGNGRNVVLENIIVLDKDNNTASTVDVLFLDTNVAVGTGPNTAGAISAANSTHILGRINLATTDSYALPNAKIVTKSSLNLTMKLASADSHLYMAAFVTGTPTQTASGIVILLTFKQG